MATLRRKPEAVTTPTPHVAVSARRYQYVHDEPIQGPCPRWGSARRWRLPEDTTEALTADALKCAEPFCPKPWHRSSSVGVGCRRGALQRVSSRRTTPPRSARPTWLCMPEALGSGGRAGVSRCRVATGVIWVLRNGSASDRLGQSARVGCEAACHSAAVAGGPDAVMPFSEGFTASARVAAR